MGGQSLLGKVLLNINESQDLTQERNQRPKKIIEFASKAHMMRYIENFKVNHKTEMCKNWV